MPERLVYCEHGNQFDPANAIADYGDPLDTPLGHHIVTDVMRGVLPAEPPAADRASGLDDIGKVYPLVAIPEYLAGRFFYDLLEQIVRWVLIPIALGYLVLRIVTYAGAGASSWRWDGEGIQRLLIEIGYDAALLLAAVVIAFIVIRRQPSGFLSSTAERLPGLHQSDGALNELSGLLASNRRLPMGGPLTGREISVFVSGHTHAPSLDEIERSPGDRVAIVNSGCWLRQLRPVPARFRGPAVFASTYVLTHVRIRQERSGMTVELWEHPRAASQHLGRAERLATIGRLPSQPSPNAAPRVIARRAIPSP